MDLAAWLCGLALGQYEQAFRENNIDPEIPADLTAGELIGLGVSSISHRRKLLAAIAAQHIGQGLKSGLTTDAPAMPPKTALPLSAAERRQITVMRSGSHADWPLGVDIELQMWSLNRLSSVNWLSYMHAMT
jgi:hypothetical protein